ncbi:MAG: hypothetical protein ACT4PL_12430 [Phycisphaerales bacterium]
MEKRRMNVKVCGRVMAVCAAGALVASAAGQPTTATPKPPAIDLEKTARTPRAGQPVAKSKEQIEEEKAAEEARRSAAAAGGGVSTAGGSEVGPDGRRIRPPVTPLPVDAARVKETEVKPPVVSLETQQGTIVRVETDPFVRRLAGLRGLVGALAWGGGVGGALWRRVFVGTGRGAERWRELTSGGEAAGVCEVRTGAGEGAALTVNGATGVEVKRLTRARLGLMDTATGDATARRVVVELFRGLVVVRPEAGTVVTVATPDATVQVREATGVWYDGGLGTRTAEWK